jgi:hypothetical protein
MFGIGAVASDRFNMDLSRQPVPVRAAINVTYLAGCVIAMLAIVLRRSGGAFGRVPSR